MGKIHVVEDIYLEADRYGYTVVCIGMRRKGIFGTKELSDELTEYRDEIGYYGSIGAAMHGVKEYVIRMGIVDGKLTTMNELLGEIKRMNDIESDLLEKLN